MNSEFLNALEETMSSDSKQSDKAKAFLKSEASKDFPTFLKNLSDILANEKIDQATRIAAGLQLEDNLTSEDEALRFQCHHKWMKIPRNIRRDIKENIISVLNTENIGTNSVARCVAHVAVVELRKSQWREVIPLLCKNATCEESSQQLKVASLKTLGFICEDIDCNTYSIRNNPGNDPVLTGIIPAMRSTDAKVCLAATQSLCLAMQYIEGYFYKQKEKKIIVDAVCEVIQSSEIPISVAGLQCLVKISSLYYQYLGSLMTHKLLPITLEVMKSKVSIISLYGMNFWSTICKKEITLQIESATPEGRKSKIYKQIKFYAKNALESLVPVLCANISKMTDLDWPPTEVAFLCFRLLTKCCKDEIGIHALAFFHANRKSPDSCLREAAMRVYGSIIRDLEGSARTSVLGNVLPTIIDTLDDVDSSVSISAARVLIYMCKICPLKLLFEGHLKLLVERLLYGFTRSPLVAVYSSLTFKALSVAAYKLENSIQGSGQLETYAMSIYFNDITQAILKATRRKDSTECSLRYFAYETFLQLIKNSPKDCDVTAQKTTIIVLNQLKQDISETIELQSSLCTVMPSVLKKMSSEDALPILDAVMTILQTICQHNVKKHGGVQPEVLFTVGTLITTLGDGFLKYIDVFRPYLLGNLENFHDCPEYYAALSVTSMLSHTAIKD